APSGPGFGPGLLGACGVHPWGGGVVPCAERGDLSAEGSGQSDQGSAAIISAAVADMSSTLAASMPAPEDEATEMMAEPFWAWIVVVVISWPETSIAISVATTWSAPSTLASTSEVEAVISMPSALIDMSLHVSSMPVDEDSMSAAADSSA